MTNDTLTHATAIVVAYLERHDVPPAELPALVGAVRAALNGEATTGDNGPEPARKLRPLPPAGDPAVPITETITPEYVASLETGQRLNVLEKHLRSFGLTPDAYRARWSLAAGYPIASPRYAALRSADGRVSGRRGLARIVEESYSIDSPP